MNNSLLTTWNIQYLGRDTNKNVIYYSYDDSFFNLRHEWSTQIFQGIVAQFREHYKAGGDWEVRGIPENRRDYIDYILHTKINDTIQNPYDIQPRLQSGKIRSSLGRRAFNQVHEFIRTRLGFHLHPTITFRDEHVLHSDR